MPLKSYSPLEKKLYRELYKKSLYEFVKGFWDVVDPVKFVDGVIIQYFCEVFEYMCRSWIGYKEIKVNVPKVTDTIDVVDVRIGDKHRLNLNMPPRHMKSMIFNVFGPVWLWLHYPIKAVSISHSKDLAKKMNEKRKRILDSDKFIELFSEEVNGVVGKVDYLTNSRGGELYSQCRENMTGYGADLIINDDLTNAETAKRDMQEMANAWSYYTHTMPSRINDIDKCFVMNVQQRLAPKDITGNILADSNIRQAYVFVVLPAVFTKDTYLVFPISGKIVLFRKGESLWKERFGDYSALKQTMPSSVWETQYEQNAIATEDTPIKEYMLKCVPIKEVPDIEHAHMIYASHDFPIKDKETSDFLGSILAYRINKTIYIKDCLETHMDYPKSIRYVQNLDNKYTGIIQVIEDKANGSPIIQQLQGTISGIKAYNPKSNSKMQRLESASLYLDNVVFIMSDFDELQQKYVLTPTLQNLYDRLLAFPYVSHDDIVDAFSQLILYIFMDSENSVYGRSFNDNNIVYDNETIKNLDGDIFFNKDGDLWKVCKIVADYDFDATTIYVVKEDRFKATIEEGIKRLKEFAGNETTYFIDCSATETLYDVNEVGLIIDYYNIEDFEKSVVELNAGFSRKTVKICKDCVITKGDIETFKYATTKNDESKFQTDRDGMCACLRVAMTHYGNVI